MQVDLQGDSRRCPSCQIIVSKTARFCRMCGNRLGREHSPLYESDPDQNDGLRLLCSACGYQNIPGELFCAQCGVQIPPIPSPPPSLPSRMEG